MEMSKDQAQEAGVVIAAELSTLWKISAQDFSNFSQGVQDGQEISGLWETFF